MNSLAYALLSMLVRKPCSGYELKQYLEVFWQARHSQIYPLLTKLESEQFLSFEHVEQSGKPDKKIYSLTDKGRSALLKWINKPPSIPVIRDEFLVKVYALWLTDIQTAKRLFEQRITMFEDKVTYRENELNKMEQQYGQEIKEIQSRHFGRYILFQRKLQQEKDEISWCNWVLDLLMEDKTHS